MISTLQWLCMVVSCIQSVINKFIWLESHCDQALLFLASAVGSQWVGSKSKYIPVCRFVGIYVCTRPEVYGFILFPTFWRYWCISIIQSKNAAKVRMDVVVLYPNCRKEAACKKGEQAIIQSGHVFHQVNNWFSTRFVSLLTKGKTGSQDLLSS